MSDDVEVDALKIRIGEIISGEDWSAVVYALAELLIEGVTTDDELRFVDEVLREVQLPRDIRGTLQ